MGRRRQGQNDRFPDGIRRRGGTRPGRQQRGPYRNRLLGKKYILHLVPSGILWPGKLCVIGNGVVLDPIGLVEEINELRGQGVSITKDNLLISDRAHVVLPFHKEMDAAQESALDKKAIGTTKRGIRPCTRTRPAA